MCAVTERSESPPNSPVRVSTFSGENGRVGEVESESVILWERRYNDLRKWREEHGNCNVPKAEGKLGRWVVRQRELQKKGKLESHRKARLDVLAFVWNTNEAAWGHKYDLLSAYRTKNGHCCVPISDPVLGMWVAKMRANRRRAKLAEHRVSKLDEIGFVWNTAEADWMDKFDKLVQFRMSVGHACVPFNEGELGWWVNTQRQAKRKGKLSETRERLLNEAAFVWNPQQFLAERRRLGARGRGEKRRHDCASGTSKKRRSVSPETHPEAHLHAYPHAYPHTESGRTVTSAWSRASEDTAGGTPTRKSVGRETPETTVMLGDGTCSRADVSSIASLLSPSPSLPLGLATVSGTVSRCVSFPHAATSSAPTSSIPSFHGAASLRCVGVRRGVHHFVLPPISSLGLGSGFMF